MCQAVSQTAQSGRSTHTKKKSIAIWQELLKGGLIKILWSHPGEWEKVTLELGVRG